MQICMIFEELAVFLGDDLNYTDKQILALAFVVRTLPPIH